MVGRLRIRELRDRVGGDIRTFHHHVFAHGPLPLDTLDEVMGRLSAACE